LANADALDEQPVDSGNRNVADRRVAFVNAELENVRLIPGVISPGSA